MRGMRKSTRRVFLGAAMPDDAQLEEEIAALYGGPVGLADAEIGADADGNNWDLVKRSHMGNFVNCLRGGETPIADVETLHRTVSTCHLCNIALRLERPLEWDAEKEDFADDTEASGMLARKQRPKCRPFRRLKTLCANHVAFSSESTLDILHRLS